MLLDNKVGSVGVILHFAVLEIIAIYRGVHPGGY